jgi:hypothetical protein
LKRCSIGYRARSIPCSVNHGNPAAEIVLLVRDAMIFRVSRVSLGDNHQTPEPRTDDSNCLTTLKLNGVLVLLRVRQQLSPSLAQSLHFTHGSFGKVALVATITTVGRREYVSRHFRMIVFQIPSP